jgi:hypothetical protein
MKDDKMGSTSITFGTDENCAPNSGQKNLKGRDHLEELDVDGRIILEWTLKK